MIRAAVKNNSEQKKGFYFRFFATFTQKRSESDFRWSLKLLEIILNETWTIDMNKIE